MSTVTVVDTAPRRPSGRPADPSLLAVLARVQAGLLLLSAGGEVAVMGNPVHAAVPLVVAVVLLRGAAVASRGPAGGSARTARRRLRAVCAVEWALLGTIPASLLVGLTGWVSWTPTLTALVTTLVLPAATLHQARRVRAAVRA
jgi:hypothetical protein